VSFNPKAEMENGNQKCPCARKGYLWITVTCRHGLAPNKHNDTTNTHAIAARTD